MTLSLSLFLCVLGRRQRLLAPLLLFFSILISRALILNFKKERRFNPVEELYYPAPTMVKNGRGIDGPTDSQDSWYAAVENLTKIAARKERSEMKTK